MPTYEFRCRTCETTFEVERSMARASDPARCPDGHGDAVRVMSVFASVASGPGASPNPPCGTADACGHCPY